MTRSDDSALFCGTVVVADDDEFVREFLQRLLTNDGHTVLVAQNGQQALDLAAKNSTDLLLVDVQMPVIDGFDVCRTLKSDDVTRLTPVVLMTGGGDRDGRLVAIEAGADDFLTKPIEALELRARVRSLIRLKRYTDELDSAEAVILSLALTIEARDQYTEGHCHRLAEYALTLGRRAGLPQDDLNALHRGGYLHDLGKIAIPDSILNKPAPLTTEEFKLMRQHTIVGDALCGNLRVLDRVRPIVRWHHERLDGSGYPDGLRGDAIPTLARIVGIADVYDALASDRPYRPACTLARTHEILIAEVTAGRLDAALVGILQDAENDGELLAVRKSIGPGGQ